MLLSCSLLLSYFNEVDMPVNIYDVLASSGLSHEQITKELLGAVRAVYEAGRQDEREDLVQTGRVMHVNSVCVIVDTGHDYSLFKLDQKYGKNGGSLGYAFERANVLEKKELEIRSILHLHASAKPSVDKDSPEQS